MKTVAEIKIQCECGHSRLLSKSNISAHRKRPIHIKKMATLSGEIQLENTIVCQPVTPKIKIVKDVNAVKDKKIKPTKGFVKVIDKKIKPSRKFILLISKIIFVKLANITNFKIIKQLDDEKLQRVNNVVEVVEYNDNPKDDSFECWKQWGNCPIICSFKYMERMREPCKQICEKTTIGPINEIVLNNDMERMREPCKQICEKTTIGPINEIVLNNDMERMREPCKQICEKTTIGPINEIVLNNDQEKSGLFSEYLQSNLKFNFNDFDVRIAVRINTRMTWIYVYDKGKYTKGLKALKEFKKMSQECPVMSCILKYVFSKNEYKKLPLVDFIVNKEIEDDLEKIWCKRLMENG
jgi:hypothetical protein